MEMNPAKPWYADEQEPPPTSGSTETKSPGRTGEVQGPQSATVEQDDKTETESGPKSGRTGEVEG